MASEGRDKEGHLPFWRRSQIFTEIPDTKRGTWFRICVCSSFYCKGDKIVLCLGAGRSFGYDVRTADKGYDATVLVQKERTNMRLSFIDTVFSTPILRE